MRQRLEEALGRRYDRARLQTVSGGIAQCQRQRAVCGEVVVVIIPANLAGSTETVLNINANKNIASLFMDFGEVVHSTVRVKTGLNKSWALVTFADREGAERAVAAGIEVMDVECEELTLKVELIDVAGHLQQSRETQGYLSLLAKTHQGSLKMSDLDTVWVGGLPAEFLGASESP